MKPTLVLLPGLGADQRLFNLQFAAFPDLAIPRWPVVRESDTLPEFAARLARDIPQRDPLFVGGSSFGGMVALDWPRLFNRRP